MPTGEPRPASHFRLKLGGKESVGVFREVSGFDSTTEAVEHHAVDENGLDFVRKVSGATTWSNITLKRGVDETLDLWKWHDSVIKEGPDKARADCTIELLDYTGKPISTLQVKQAWPCKWVEAPLSAGSNEVALEELEICHEGLERM